jgi:hypothetical protein
MLLAAFLMQPHPPALPLRVIVVEVHLQRGRDAGETVDQQGDQRAVAQPDDRRYIDAVEQCAGLVAEERARRVWRRARCAASAEITPLRL